MLVALVATAAPRAFAQTRASELVALTWRAPGACPSQQDVLREIDRLLAGASRPAQRLSADARVLQHDGVFELRLLLQTGSAREQRSVSSASCRTASDTTALLIAIAVDPTLDPAGSSESGASLDVPASDALPQATDHEPPALVAAPSGSLHAELGFGLLLDTVLLPALSAGPTLRAGIAWHALHLALSAGYLPERSAHAAASPGNVYGDVDALRVALSGCYLAALGSLELGPCVEAGSANVRVSPQALERTDRRRARADFLGLSLAGNIRLAPLVFLAPALGVSMVLRRPVFAITGAGTLHEPRALGGSASVSCVFQFE